MIHVADAPIPDREPQHARTGEVVPGFPAGVELVRARGPGGVGIAQLGDDRCAVRLDADQFQVRVPVDLAPVARGFRLELVVLRGQAGLVERLILPSELLQPCVIGSRFRSSRQHRNQAD